VKFYDEETKRTFVLLTNNFELSALQIVLLYKNRWQVELFFKWIKQHLKIKCFWRTSENSVRIQIYSAIIAYCLVAIVGYDLKIDRSTYELLQVFGISLLDKSPVYVLFTDIDYTDVNELDYNQLLIS
jgi:transposase